MLDDLDDPAALVHHDVARTIDLVDEIAVDEDARQYPAAHEQDKRAEDADMRVQQGAGLDAESAAPPRRAAKAPLVAEGEAQRQRTEDHDQEERENRMVEQQRTLADDPHADENDHRRNQDAEDAERIIDQQASQLRARPAAEVLRLDAQRQPLLRRELQAALVGGPAEERKQHGRSGEHADEQQQKARDPAGAVAVGAFDALTSVFRSSCICRIFRCHLVLRLILSSEVTHFFRHSGYQGGTLLNPAPAQSDSAALCSRRRR